MELNFWIPAAALIAITAFAVWRGFEQEKRENKRNNKP